MIRRIRWIGGYTILVYATGLMYVTGDVITGLIAILIAGWVTPQSVKQKEQWKGVSFWQQQLLNLLFLGILYVIWLYNQPNYRVTYGTATIVDPITAETERIVTTMDVGAGYLLWMLIYFNVFVLLSNVPLLLGFGAFFLTVLFGPSFEEDNPELMKTKVFGTEIRHWVPLLVGFGCAAYITWRFFDVYLWCVDQVNLFVFGMDRPHRAFRLSIPIERLTKILTSVGAAPSFAKFSAVILAITGAWSSYEAATNLVKFTGSIVSRLDTKVESKDKQSQGRNQ